MQSHNSEVDSSDKVLNLIEQLGESTAASSCSGNWGESSDVPAFSAYICLYSSASRLRDTFDCGRKPGSEIQRKRRLCYCHSSK